MTCFDGATRRPSAIYTIKKRGMHFGARLSPSDMKARKSLTIASCSKRFARRVLAVYVAGFEDGMLRRYNRPDDVQLHIAMSKRCIQ